ncbi:short transient receptor potential channel 6-like isoform X2 [Montipora foliosa]|uniref:short transient receptor potential channel 6-like isoform X2 n=1 Tax=Montipora foliosa TaxID=591990 RepID=UPI0035F2032A
MFRELLETVTQDVEANPDNVNEHPLQVNNTLENEVVNGGQKKGYRKQLLEALDKEDPDEVLELIRVDGFRNKQNAETLKTLNDTAKDEQQRMENFDEEEREWIKILSNPLYISLKWFWRIYTIPSGKESEEQDVIVSALRDSRLLQMIAGNDLHQHNKEYQGRADEIEEFAIAVVEGSTHEQLLDIMDTQGGGCLKQKKSENFSQSLGVLKIAADLERIKNHRHCSQSKEWVILGFVVGLLVQEFLEFWREGYFIYFSKWWNVVDTMIILLFASAYSIWLTSFAYYGKQWKPEKTSFIIADVFFSSGIVVAFFHLTHAFQVDSVLGPLQLSLYRMLRDVWKFLLLFLLLYISFATGLTKMYSYYVASQIKLEQRNMTHHEKWHPYADHVNTGRDLFWLFLGVFDENKIVVKDPAFHAVSLVGHLFIIVYAVCMVIVALNMLIAMMSKSFEDIKEDSDIWKFSRTRMWLESIDKGNVLPAPVNLIYYGLKIICTVIKWFIKCSSQGGEQQGRQPSEAHEHRLKTMKRLVMKFLKERYKKHPVSVGQRTRVQTT